MNVAAIFQKLAGLCLCNYGSQYEFRNNRLIKQSAIYLKTERNVTLPSKSKLLLL
jgi:hypothetical protein